MRTVSFQGCIFFSRDFLGQCVNHLSKMGDLKNGILEAGERGASVPYWGTDTYPT